MADEGGGLSGTEPLRPADLIVALPVALLVVDGDGRVRECNAAAEALLNLGRSAAIGRTVAELIGHGLPLPADQPFAAYDLDLALPAGRSARADLSAAPLVERPGWRVLVIHGRAAHDPGARRGAREGRGLPTAAAAAMLAHEIKNPLSGIRGAAQLLEAGAAPEQGELTLLIRREVDRITRLIDRMEGLAEHRQRPARSFNIHAVLGHVRDVAQAGFAGGLTIRELYDPSLPDVLANRDALVQVLLNLLKNAAEASGPQGTITLATAYRQGLSVAPGARGERRPLPIELRVIDDGPGAPPELAPHLFEPFVSGKPMGSGLGLAIVDKLVGEMGGVIEYAREGRPERTVFRLLLPRALSRRRNA